MASSSSSFRSNVTPFPVLIKARRDEGCGAAYFLPQLQYFLCPPSGKWGMEICNDIDFPLLSRQYANDGAGLTLVPAWDFVTDGWLHGRMAILRCVESGFSIASVPVRNERTLYDWVGDWLPGWISFSSSLCLPAFHIRGSWFRDPAQRVIGIRR